MTLAGLAKRLKRSLWLVVVVALVSGALGYGVSAFVPTTFTAEASIWAGSELGAVETIVLNTIEDGGYDQQGVDLLVTRISVRREVSVMGSGPDADECLRVVNAVVSEAADTAHHAVGVARSGRVQSEAAALRTDSAQTSTPRRIMVAAYGGFLGALLTACAIAIWALTHPDGDDDDSRPVVSGDGIAPLSVPTQVSSLLPPRVETVLLYLLAAGMIFTANTLIAFVPPFGTTATLTMMLVVAFLTLAYGWKTPIAPRFLCGWCAWCTLIITAHIIVTVAHNESGGFGMQFFCVLWAELPLFLHLLRRRGHLEKFFTAIVNVMLFLSATSLVLWVIGPLTHLIRANVCVSTTWNDAGTAMNRWGYFGLLFSTQTTELFGLTITRNSGVFTESPMYCFSLCCAILFELFVRHKPRLGSLALLFVTMATTVASSGLIVSLIAVLLYVAEHLNRRDTRHILPVVAGVVCVVCGVLLVRKLGSSSGNIRVDDYRAGLLAWKDRAILGHGFNNSKPAQAYMSTFRVGNYGLSNGIVAVLEEGGLVFALPYLTAFFGFLRPPSWRVTSLGICTFMILATLIVTELPLFALLLSVGLENTLAGTSPRAGR